MTVAEYAAAVARIQSADMRYVLRQLIRPLGEELARDSVAKMSDAEVSAGLREFAKIFRDSDVFAREQGDPNWEIEPDVDWS